MTNPKEKKEVIDTGKIIGKMEFTLRDKLGNIKRLWNENRLGKYRRLKYGIDSQFSSKLYRWIFGSYTI